MEKIRNLSLKKTILLYLVIALVVSFFSSAIINKIAEDTQERIFWKYIDKELFFDATSSPYYEHMSFRYIVSPSEMNPKDRNIKEICDFVSTWSVLLISIAGSGAAVGLFYKNKLREPIKELEKASKFIAQDELDFNISYENKDELGKLCKEFEKMRIQLVENNRTVWHIVEEEKTLRAAIAHDIRSPLSILKGYQEMLLEFIPENTLDKGQIIEMLLEGMKQIERMNQFIETMRKMSSLWDRELQFHMVNLQDLGEQIQRDTVILSKDSKKSCIVTIKNPRSICYVDREVVLEVVDNLLSNALRYAKKEVEIVISSEEYYMVIEVLDDGNGFNESSETVTKAFYHSNPQDNLQHFGIGMYISRIYCEKHGGKLLIGNHKDGGALVRACFKSIITG